MPVIPSGTVADPVHVNLAAGEGGADASAANQALQITQETAINSALGTAVASPAANTVLDRLKSLAALLPTALTAGGSLKVSAVEALPAGSNSIGKVGVSGVRVSVTLTRPADTTAYAVNDAVSDSTSSPTVLTFSGMATANGGSGSILKAQLITNQSTNTAQFRLHLFNVAPSAVNDNAAYPMLWANRAARVGTVDFPACATEGSGSDAATAQWIDLPLYYVCGAADTALYGILETKAAFTPASGQLFYIALSAEQY